MVKVKPCLSGVVEVRRLVTCFLVPRAGNLLIVQWTELSKERVFIERMPSDRKLKVYREVSK